MKNGAATLLAVIDEVEGNSTCYVQKFYGEETSVGGSWGKKYSVILLAKRRTSIIREINHARHGGSRIAVDIYVDYTTTPEMFGRAS